jgi:hypothetical protein
MLSTERKEVLKINLLGSEQQRSNATAAAVVTAVNGRSHAAGTKAIIDIDYRNARRTAVQHAEQRGNTTKARSIPDTGWHSYNRPGNQTGHNTRQGAFHAGDNDKNRGGLDEFTLFKQPMNTGNADIKGGLDGLPMAADRQRRLLRNGYIRCAGRQYDNSAAVAGRIRFRHRTDQHPRLVMICKSSQHFPNCGPLFRTDAGGNGHTSTIGQTGQDLCYLPGTFVFAKDNLGKAGPNPSMVVDPGKTEHLDRPLPHGVHCFSDRNPAFLHIIQQADQSFFIHSSISPIVLHIPAASKYH